MEKIVKLKIIPENSIVANGFENIDYFDSYRLIKFTNDNIEKITSNIFQVPSWVNALMSIRNSIVKVFGLKTNSDAKMEQTTYFKAIEQNENELVMQENDKHLNFRVSVLADRTASFIYLTTLVHFNNALGKTYFFIIKPFHKIIIRSILKRQLA